MGICKSNQLVMFCKKCFLENFAKFTCARISFSIKLQATLAQMFSCEFCEIFENGLFYNTPLVVDSVRLILF